MSAVPVTLVGITYDANGSPKGPVTFVGQAFVTGLGVGGGPPLGMWGGGGVGNYPDQSLPGQQPGIWGPINTPDQGLPGGRPPGMWGPINNPDQGLPNPGRPGHGLPGNQPYPGQGLPGNQPYPGQGLPGNQPYPGQGLPPIIPVPPDAPNVPPPGAPPQIVSGTQPNHPITPPEAVIIEYPGIGKVVVPKPTETTAGSVG